MGECHSEDLLLVPYKDEVPAEIVDLLWRRGLMGLLVKQDFRRQEPVQKRNDMGKQIIPGTC